MATVIDELVVKLGLDPKGLNAGQKEALEGFRKFKDDASKEQAKREKEEAQRQKRVRDEATKTANELDTQGRKATQGFFDRLTAGALELFAVLVGAGSLEKFVASTVTGLTNVSNAATAVGLNVRDLQAFGAVIEAMGGNADTAKAELTGLAKTLEAWNTLGIDPGTNFWMALNAVGGTTKDSPTELYKKFADYAQNEPDKAKAAQMGRYLGFAQDADAVEAMKGRVKVTNDLAEALKRTPDSADIDRVRQLGIEWRTTGQEMQGALQKFLGANATALSPQSLIDFDKGLISGFAGLPGQGLVDIWNWWRGIWGKKTGGAAAPSDAGGSAGVAGLRPGIVAGLFAESRLDPTAFNATGGGQGAYGIAQWRGARLDRLKQFAAARHKSPSDLSTQIAFMGWEFANTHRGAAAAINSAPTEEAALSAFLDQYEQPGRGTAGDIRRGLAFLHRAGGASGSGTVINIAAININGAGIKDAQGVARGVGGALRNNLVNQANSGLR